MQQSQSPSSSPPPLPPTVPAQSPSQAICKLDPGSQRPGDPDQIQPDLSHLTPEERRIIEDVINRQRQEELIDRSQALLSIPICQVVHRGSKVFQRLPALTDASPSSSSTSTTNTASASNAQLANSIGGPVARAKDEFFGGVTRRGLCAEKPLPSVHHNRTSGDLFGAVSNFFTRTGGGSGNFGDVCEICHVTKFTGNAGHKCVQCNLKTCVRCGGWFGTQSSWMCKNCFSNLSSPSAMTHVAKGAKTPLPSGPTSYRRESFSSPLNTTESTINPRMIPKIAPTSTPATASTSSSLSASNVAPVERGLSSYASVASRTRLREAMKDNRSLSEEDRVWSHYQPTPSSHTYLLHSHQSPKNYYQHPPVPPHSHPHKHQHPQRQQSYSSIPPRYLQQHSSHYPAAATATAQHPYNAPHFRHSTGPQVDCAYRRPLGEAAWIQPVMPPPLRFERHAFRSMEGGGVEGGRVSTTSCGSTEDSPHGGFRAGYLRRSGGGQMDPGSVSEPCKSEAYSRGDYRKSFTTESRMYQRSIEVDRPSSGRSAFWSPSQDGESLIGQVYLRKCRASGEIGLLSSFGLKLVIGKRVPSDMVGTFVSSVKEGSVADVMGELQTGDEILEWNGHNLRGLHQEEVSEILALSRNADEVWLTVQRVIDDYCEESDGADSTSLSRPGEDARFQEEEEEYGDDFGPGDADPHLQLKLLYDEEKQALIVSVLAARDLPPQLNTQTWLCSSFCQITILPETNKYEPRCTRVARNTNDPIWIHNVTYENFVINSKELEVAVFDYLRGRTAFIGEVLINLQVADLSGRAYWYPIPPGWDNTDQDLSSQVQSESGTFEGDEWSGEALARVTAQVSHRPVSGGRHALRNISPRSVPSQLSASASAVADRQKRQQPGGQRTSRRESRAPAQPGPPKTHAADRGARFSLSEDDQSFLSDNSEASGFSSFSKLSLQSNRLRQRQHQRLNASKLGSTARRISRSRADCHSPLQDLLAETGEEEEAELEEDEGKQSRGREERPPDDQPKSSSTEEKSVSSSTAAAASNVAFSSGGFTETTTMTTAGATKATAAAATPSTARKRRSSIGHRFSNVLGISKKNTATSGTDKKNKASFQRSEEVLPAYIQTNEKGTVSGGYKAPGVVAEGAGFGGIASSSVQSSVGGGFTGQAGHHGSGLQHTLSSVLHSSSSCSSSAAATAARKDQLALEMGEVHVGEFVEGLGPGQLVGRQVLGMPCLGEIQLSFFDRKGHLEVEVIRARGLHQKNTSKPLPTPYVKLHLLEGKQSVEKMRTTAPARRTLDPLFQQQFSFSNSYKDKILQVSVWGEYGRMDKKVFLGMCEIVLDDLSLRSIVFGWYKLFGMIAATAQHHKQVRRHTSFGGTSTASTTTSGGTAQTSSSGKRHASKKRQPRGKS